MLGRLVRWRLLTLGERARREHEVWLTRAMTPGRRAGGPRYPRIPVRRVDEGGFEPIMRQPTGRAWADGWWRDAFEQVEGADRGEG